MGSKMIIPYNENAQKIAKEENNAEQNENAKQEEENELEDEDFDSFIDDNYN